jgi:hypothetical protein
MIQVHGADVAATLDQREHLSGGFGVQRSTGRLAGLWGFGQVRFIGLDGHAKATQRPSIGAGCHGQTNAMSHEPRGFHAAAKHALKLAGADAFLGGTHEIDRLQPVGHWSVAIFEYSANLYGELLAALIALAQTRARGFTSELVNPRRIAVSAMRADRTRRPQMSLYVFVCGFFVFEVRGVEVRVHVFGSGIAKECACACSLSSVTPPCNFA